MYLLGCDIGSSSIKVALVEVDSGRTIKVVQRLQIELDILSRKAGWAEQESEVWWTNLCWETQKLLKKPTGSPKAIQVIGIAYQMHGLVAVDEDHEVLRPAIIWCDSRAVEIGNEAFNEIGKQRCMEHLLKISTGAAGAAKASGIAIGVYSNLEEVTKTNKMVATYEPDQEKDSYQRAYQRWLNDLGKIMQKEKQINHVEYH